LKDKTKATDRIELKKSLEVVEDYNELAKNKKNYADKLEIKKDDPIVRKQVVFKKEK